MGSNSTAKTGQKGSFKSTTKVVSPGPINISANVQHKVDMNSPSAKKNPYLKKEQAGKGIVPSPTKVVKTEKPKVPAKVPEKKKTVVEKPVQQVKKLLPTDGQQKPANVPTGLVQKQTAPAPYVEQPK